MKLSDVVIAAGQYENYKGKARIQLEPDTLSPYLVYLTLRACFGPSQGSINEDKSQWLYEVHDNDSRQTGPFAIMTGKRWAGLARCSFRAMFSPAPWWQKGENSGGGPNLFIEETFWVVLLNTLDRVM